MGQLLCFLGRRVLLHRERVEGMLADGGEWRRCKRFVLDDGRETSRFRRSVDREHGQVSSITAARVFCSDGGTYRTRWRFFAVSFSLPFPPVLPLPEAAVPASSYSSSSASTSKASASSDKSKAGSIEGKTASTSCSVVTRLFCGRAARRSRRLWDLEYGAVLAFNSAYSNGVSIVSRVQLCSDRTHFRGAVSACCTPSRPWSACACVLAALLPLRHALPAPLRGLAHWRPPLP